MPKLLNEMVVQASINSDDIIYTNKGDVIRLIYLQNGTIQKWKI